MSLSTPLLSILKEDLEYRKDVEAKWPFDCDGCGQQVLPGERFCFMGNKKKVCGGCVGTMAQAVEEMQW